MASLSLLDPLYCQEESLELEDERMGPMLPLSEELDADRHLLPGAAAVEEWAKVLHSMAAKDGEARAELLPHAGGDDTYLLSARREAVEWVVRATARHAFSVLTALLAVDYLDRCFLHSAAAGGLRLQRDKLWMGRLAAVACLSLAAKVEETRVPQLLYLQVAKPSETDEEEENRYVFEAKTIRRMEVLVLSALGWRMNPVTPLSFIHHLLPRLCSSDKKAISTTISAARIRELLSSCEAVLLSVIADWRWVRYPASVWAAAALLHAAEAGGGPAAAALETHHLISVLNVPKERVEECHQLVMESMVCDGNVIGHRRKRSSSSFHYSNVDSSSSPPSPNCVIGSCFSCESSSPSCGSDSCTMWPSSVSSSPETRPSKIQNCTADKAFGSEHMVEDGVLTSVSM